VNLILAIWARSAEKNAAAKKTLEALGVRVETRQGCDGRHRPLDGGGVRQIRHPRQLASDASSFHTGDTIIIDGGCMVNL
jgi:hypothetical protein